MGLRINTNLASINAQRNLENVSGRLRGSFQRLSTGLRISTAADDAAGLAISERFRAQIRSLSQAKRNAMDGISLVQTGEGALNEVSNILTRLRELSIQSANGAISGLDQNTLQEEFNNLVGEITRIARSTEFNGIQLLDGSASSLTFHVGIGTTTGIDSISLSLTSTLASNLGLNNLNIGSSGSPESAVGAIDAAINTVSSVRGSFGALQNRLDATIANLGVAHENLSAAESRIRDADIAYETATMTRNSILQQSAISILSQANLQPQSALSLLSR